MLKRKQKKNSKSITDIKILKNKIMESEKDLNAKIFQITALIQNSHPELSKYLVEMPITIPIENNPKINSESLKKYYDSLVAILKKYNLEHTFKKPLL